MGVKRTALSFEKDFARIPNAWLRDERLTRKARGLLAEIMTHSVGWHVSVRGLEKSGLEGRDAIRAALVELKEAGYLQVSQSRGERGRWSEVEYELCDPATVNGFSVSGGLPGVGLSASGQSDHKKTISIEDHPEELLSVSTDDAIETVLSVRLGTIWDLWPVPRRSTRKVVERSLRSAMKVADWAMIIRAAEEHVRVWSSWPTPDLKYVPLLSTWLNQERWTGALPEPRRGQLSALDLGREADALLAETPHLRALS